MQKSIVEYASGAYQFPIRSLLGAYWSCGSWVS